MMNKTFSPSTTTINQLIAMFNVCPASDGNTSVITMHQILTSGMQKGYLIDIYSDPKYATAFINNITMQYNSTFYKSWGDVTNKSRFELLVDQVLHYMTTYGTDFSLGDGYVPNVHPEEPAWNTYKIIKSCTWNELYNKCMDMICSGIALKSTSVNAITNYIIEYVKFTGVDVYVDNIKNREALVILCDALGILPNNGQKLFAHIVYKTTGDTMIVKNRATRNAIKLRHGISDKLFAQLNDTQMVALAEIFNRYKPLFLAFKNKNTASVINKISRLSKTHHKPMKIGFWEKILNTPLDEIMRNPNLTKYMDEVSNFKLVQLLQAIRERLVIAKDSGEHMYIIRNGKIFAKDNNEVMTNGPIKKWTELSLLYKMLHDRLVENLSTKKCAVKFPEKYNLTCPTSEKNFIGNFPMGTSCELGQESIIGIYWRNEWGAHDFDLSYEGIDGTRISWNGDYYSGDKKIIYSGDITNATDGANEVIKFVGKEIPNGIVSVNRFNGVAGAKYRLYFGIDNNPMFHKLGEEDMLNYMVDPNNVSLEAEIEQGDMSQQSIGIVINGKFYFYSLSCGYGRIKTALQTKIMKDTGKHAYMDTRKESEDKLIKILERKNAALLSIKDTLLEAGFWEATEDDSEVLDLTTLDRNTIIDLFSKVC